MTNKYVSLVFLSFLLFSCNNSDEEIIVKNTVEFPNIDNSKEMGVGTTLSVPISKNVQLDSMKVYYYQDYSNYSPNLPGKQGEFETKELPLPPTLNEFKHYFTYESNGFVDKRTIVYSDFYNQAKFKFVFDFDYNVDNQLNNVKLDLYMGDEKVVSENLPYSSETEQQYLNQIQANEYNIIRLGNMDYITPKNVFNPERNLLPVNNKLQYLTLFSSEIYNSSYDGLLELLEGDFTNNTYINTHVTFLKNLKNKNGFTIPLTNLQYKVRQDHYPEIIQYGDVLNGGFRYLYYYKN